MIRIRIDIRNDLLERLVAALAPESLDLVVDRVAVQGLRMAVEATPKHWFGQVRRSWQMKKPRLGTRLLVNDNKIMLWLEEGTRDHGPVKAKALYIPLVRRAAFGYQRGMVFGVDFVMAKRVRGIQARHIAAKLREVLADMMLAAMKDHVRRAIA